jgi:1-acyl-sn-glycerol-3-phosphate acyltransferase
MKKAQNAVVFFLFTYLLVGIGLGIVFWLLRLIGVLEVRGWENFPHWRKRVLVVSNHPSKVEPGLLIGMFFHQYLLRPFQYGPWIMADRKEFYESRLYWPVRPRVIPVDRTKPKGDARSLINAKKVLASDAILVVLPEGGRTFKATDHITSRTGRRLGWPLKEGFVLLATEPGVITLPAWFDFNGWFNMRLTVGKPVIFTTGTPREEIVQRTSELLLELADQVS